MSDTITITGNLAADPEQRSIGNGVTVTSFRVASNQGHRDRNSGEWVEGDPNWYLVSAFRRLGEHAFASLHKGERVIVTGRLKVRRWENDKGKGVSLEIDADAVGHDLRWGTTRYTRAGSAEEWRAPGSDAHAPDPQDWPAAEPRSAPAGGDPAAPADRDWGGSAVADAPPAPADPEPAAAGRELVDAPF